MPQITYLGLGRAFCGLGLGLGLEACGLVNITADKSLAYQGSQKRTE